MDFKKLRSICMHDIYNKNGFENLFLLFLLNHIHFLVWQTFPWAVPLGTTLPKSHESWTQFKE
jgi:hypothetical protein